MIVARG
ncbi:hypothetical protein VCHC17A1_2991A, partial [Vibrio cholerae HC-17A1]